MEKETKKVTVIPYSETIRINRMIGTLHKYQKKGIRYLSFNIEHIVGTEDPVSMQESDQIIYFILQAKEKFVNTYDELSYNLEVV